MMAAIGIGTVAAQAIKREHKVENNGYEWVKLSIAGSEIVGAEDTKGNVLIPLSEEFSMISFVPHDEKGYFSVKKNNRNGAYSITGVELVPPAYDYLAYFGNEGFKYRVGDKWYSLGVYLTGIPKIQTQESQNTNIIQSNDIDKTITISSKPAEAEEKSLQKKENSNYGCYDLGIGFVADEVKSYSLDLLGMEWHLGNNIYLAWHWGLTYIYSKTTESLYGATYTTKFSVFNMPCRFGLGYRIVANENLSIVPFAGIDFNSIVSAQLKLSYGGEEESVDIFEDSYNVGIDFTLGLRLNMKKMGVFGKYHIPLNDTQEVITGDDGYLEIGVSLLF